MTKIVLICSAARSGSTLLDMLLGGIEGAASLGEFSFLGKSLALNQLRSCGVPVRDCLAWSEIFDYIKSDKKIDLKSTPYLLRQWDTRASVVIDKNQQTKAEIIKCKIRSAICDLHYNSGLAKLFLNIPPSLRAGVSNSFYLYETISKVWGSDFIIDSSKNIHKALSLYNEKPESIKIIYLVRDGRGVFFSRRSSGFSLGESIGGWYNYNKRADRILMSGVEKENFLKVHYEDLVEDLPRTLRDMCGFIGAKFDESIMSLKGGNRHMVNGNKTMYEPDKKIKLDTRWHTELTGVELDYFTKKCGSLNAKLGYS